MVTIAQISDLHVGSPHFVPNLANRILTELDELAPDAVLATGDLTNDGLAGEYKGAAAYLSQIRQPLHVIPGNHDSRNVGYVHFEELFGERHWATDIGPVRVVAVDSSEPDLNEGRVGRESYGWIRESFACSAELKIFVLHHHLIPIPGTGRERSTVADAGDLLELLLSAGADLVLTGHKHVPHVWRLEHLYIANAGTATSLKLRGHTKPCYSVVEYDRGQVRIHRKFPFGQSSLIAHWNPRTGEQYHREFEPLFAAPIPPEQREHDAGVPSVAMGETDSTGARSGA
ncbi:MAG: metallophosphoesterase [Euzebyales bacterium]|nr:metallophosphoesterase [Euzebyales bacterium]